MTNIVSRASAWRSAAEVDRPVWKHWLTIVQPAQIRFNTALLFIGSGSNNNPAPTVAADRTLQTDPAIKP